LDFCRRCRLLTMSIMCLLKKENLNKKPNNKL
jgi:hypothetical protein